MRGLDSHDAFRPDPCVGQIQIAGRYFDSAGGVGGQGRRRPERSCIQKHAGFVTGIERRDDPVRVAGGIVNHLRGHGCVRGNRALEKVAWWKGVQDIRCRTLCNPGGNVGERRVIRIGRQLIDQIKRVIDVAGGDHVGGYRAQFHDRRLKPVVGRKVFRIRVVDEPDARRDVGVLQAHKHRLDDPVGAVVKGVGERKGGRIDQRAHGDSAEPARIGDRM